VKRSRKIVAICLKKSWLRLTQIKMKRNSKKKKMRLRL